MLGTSQNLRDTPAGFWGLLRSKNYPPPLLEVQKRYCPHFSISEKGLAPAGPHISGSKKAFAPIFSTTLLVT